jgi:DNA topoisomerase-3
MIGAIDAVCDVARRIIGKLATQEPIDGGSGGAGGSMGNGRPPTPAMTRFAASIARQKRLALPAGYATSGLICRAFLEQHAPKKAPGEAAAGTKPASPAQLAFAESIAREKHLALPDEAKASASSLSAWIDAHRGGAPSKREPSKQPRNPVRKRTKTAAKPASAIKRARKPKAGSVAITPSPARRTE